VPISSARANFKEWCTVVMHFGTPKVHFIRLEAWFFVNGTLIYDKVFVFYSPMESLFWILLLRFPIFEGPKSVFPFHQHGPTLCNGVLLVMHFGTPKVHFIRIEAWFDVNGTLKYDKVFVFYSPMESSFWIWLSSEFQFLKAQSPCTFFNSKGQFFGVVYCLLCILAHQKSISLG
jgi:hypothetical protein